MRGVLLIFGLLVPLIVAPRPSVAGTFTPNSLCPNAAPYSARANAAADACVNDRTPDTAHALIAALKVASGALLHCSVYADDNAPNARVIQTYASHEAALGFFEHANLQFNKTAFSAKEA